MLQLKCSAQAISDLCGFFHMLLILPNAYHKIYIGNIVTHKLNDRFFDVDMEESVKDHIRRLAWGVEFLMDIEAEFLTELAYKRRARYMFGTLGGNMRATSN